MPEIIFVVIIWFVFRALMSGAKKQEAQRRATRRDETRIPQRKSSRPWGMGGWAEMLGYPGDQRETAAPNPARESVREKDAAFGGPPPSQNAAWPPVTSFMEGYSPTEGVDECHEYMLPEAVSAESSYEPVKPIADRASGLPLQINAPALVQGIVLAEILTRPALRRRAGTWPRR